MQLQYSNLYENVHLPVQFPYIINSYIREYDLSKANISVLRSIGVIDDNTYYQLYNAERMQRQIFVGNMIRDNKEIGYQLKRGLMETKKALFELNQIQDYEVLCIKNDAIFIIGRELNITRIDQYREFKCKNVYTIFMKLRNLEIYYADRYTPDGQISINIDVKGISDTLLPLHQDGMLDLICTVCGILQRNTAAEALKYLMEIYELFLQRKLPAEYYREFNGTSAYTIVSKFSIFQMMWIPEHYVSVIDINWNLLILRDLISIVSNLYTQESRRG